MTMLTKTKMMMTMMTTTMMMMMKMMMMAVIMSTPITADIGLEFLLYLVSQTSFRGETGGQMSAIFSVEIQS